jgi:hypothetical protein
VFLQSWAEPALGVRGGGGGRGAEGGGGLSERIAAWEMQDVDGISIMCMYIHELNKTSI